MRAFEALARRHQAALYRTAVRVTGDPADAEDAAPGGAAGRLATPRPVPRRRGVLDVDVPPRHQPVRRGAAPPPSAAGAPTRAHELAAPDSPERAAQFDVELAALGRAVQDLPDDLRVCWVLRELEGLGYGEIAEITGAGETTVRGRIHRAGAAGGGDAGMAVDSRKIALLPCGRDAAAVWDRAEAGLAPDAHERRLPALPRRLRRRAAQLDAAVHRMAAGPGPSRRRRC